MSATTDEQLATVDRALDLDPKACADVLQLRAKELARYHEPILRLARPVLVELFVLHAATFTEADTPPDTSELLAALSLALGEPRLLVTLKVRVAKVRATLASEAARQNRSYPDGAYAPDLPMPTGRG